MTGHRCLVTRNPTADVERTRGHGLAWMITCPVCVRASQYAAQKHDQRWTGTGERYAADYGTAPRPRTPPRTGTTMTTTTTATTEPLAAPFPWFGGKRRAAPLIWQLLGDPAGYVEPFAGSAAVLLARPGFTGRRVETINDADGWLVNTWRAIQLAPDAVARHAWGPVTEIDYHARLAWLQERRSDGLVTWLEGAPEAHDAKAAGWWLYVVACGIGDPFGPGPWRVTDGHLRKTNAGRGVNRELPHLGNAGQGWDPLAGYMRALAARLTRVRITCGDWQRVTRPSVTRAGTGGDGTRAVLLDPPYTTSGGVYAHGDTTGDLSTAARDWAQSPHAAGLRVIITGYDHEHDSLLDHGWTVHQGKSGSGAGYATRPDNGRRERIWASPACITPHTQQALL